MAGLIVTIGGKVDPSLKAALMQAESATAASRARLNQQSKDLQRALMLSKDSRSPAAVYAVEKAIEATRIATDAATRAHVLERTEIEKKISAYKKLQTAAFAAQGGRFGGNTGFLKFLSGESSAVSRAEARANNPMQGPDLDGAIRHANDVEQARRNIKARSLRRERAEARANANAETAEKIAKEKAEQLALASVAARGFGPGRNMYGGHGGAGSPAGVVSEFAVIGHEIMQGRGTGRILGSISILGQRLGWLRKLIKTTADEHIDAAMASGVALTANSKESLSLEVKAIATEKDFFATEADKIATRQAADASLIRTAALRKETLALVEKAEMEKVNAKVTASPLGKMGIAGLLLAVTAGAVGLMVNKGKQMAQALNPYSSAGVKLDRSAAIDHTAVAWRSVSEAISEANRHYDDANERAKRHLEIIKETYDNHRAMLDAQKEGELVSATSAQEKFEIEKKYRQQQLQLDAQQRADEVTAKREQAKGLAAETGALIDKAQGITASGVEEEEPHKNRVKMLQEKAQKGQEFLDQQHELENKLQSGGTEGLWANIKKQGYESYLGGVNQKSTRAEILAAMNKAKGMAGADVMAGKAAQDAEEPWAAKNALRNKLRGEATEKGGQSQALGREATDSAKLNAKINADAQKQNDEKNRAEQKKLNQIDSVQRARETAAEVAILAQKIKSGTGFSNAQEKFVAQKELLEKRSSLAGMIGGGAGTASNNLTQMQRLGAFSAQGGSPLIALNQDMRNSLRTLVSLYGKQQREISNKQGGVTH